MGLIPEKRDETRCKDLHEKILKGFELAKQGDALQELWIECEDNKVLKYATKDVSNSVVVINQKDISAARKNIQDLDYFCQRVEETDILRVDHVHILRQNLSYHHKRLKNESFQFNQDTDATNQKKLILTQLFPLNKADSKMEIFGKDEFTFNKIGHGVSFVSELWHKFTKFDDSAIIIALFLKFKNIHRNKKRIYVDIYKKPEVQFNTSSIHHESSHIKKSIGREVVDDENKKVKPTFEGVVTRRRYKHILEAVDKKTDIFNP